MLNTNKYSGLLLFLLSFLFSCENYIENDQINAFILESDLSVKLKVLTDDDNNSSFSQSDSALIINVDDNLSVSSGAVSILPNKNYKLIVEMKNESADPLFLYSFWKSAINQSRQYTFCGTNGNPPISDTQKKSNQWLRFEESFSTNSGEKFMVFRILSSKGKFSINNISIVEQN